MKKTKNFEIDKRENSVFISVNPKIYPLEVLYSAGYVFLDKAYVLMDGDPKDSITVQLKAKNRKENLEKLALDFNNELLSYAVYVVQAARTSEIRKVIVERALLTAEDLTTRETNESCECGTDEETDDWIDDPLGIAKPWTPESAKGISPVGEIGKKKDKKNEKNKKHKG